MCVYVCCAICGNGDKEGSEICDDGINNVLFGTVVEMFLVGFKNVCAIDSKSVLICWGTDVPNFMDDLKKFYISVGFGDNVICAICNDNIMYCWGDSQKDNYLLSVVFLGIYIMVDIGYHGGCVLTLVGLFVCWGFVNVGNFGVSMIKVILGVHYVCGIMVENKVYCWGTNMYQVVIVSVGSYIDIDVGVWYICAITMGGVVVCWGEDYVN